MFHRSERLLLRPVWPEDWRGIFSGIADEGIVRHLASAPWPYRETDAQAFAALPCEPRTPRFVISRADDAAIVGCIGLEPMEEHADDGEECAVELGYWIARDFWGCGYATEAGRAVLEIARTLGHRRIIGSHFVDNPASGRVLARLGFVATGRTLMRYSCGRQLRSPSLEYSLDLDQFRLSAASSARSAA